METENTPSAPPPITLENGAAPLMPEPEPEKKKRGRPPGAKNKPKDPDAAPAAPDAPGASPFAASPPGDKKQPKKKTTGAPRRANILSLIPADKIAPQIVEGSEKAVIMLAAIRYGDDAANAALALSPNERAIFSLLTEELIRDLAMELTPGEAMALLLCVSFVPRFAALEYIRAQEMKRTATVNVEPTP